MRIITLQKLAKIAGVSVSTASKALNNSRDISEETKKLVSKIARENGYFEEQKKKKLENKKPTEPAVGILCPEIISVHYSEIVTFLCRLIEENGGKAFVFISDFSTEKQNSIIEKCIAEKSIDALICLFSKHIETERLLVPTVFLSENEDNDTVRCDVRKAIYDAVLYLKSKGHTKIGFIGEPLTLSKEKYFKDSMQQIFGKYDESFIYCENGRFEDIGKLAAEKMLAENRSTLPTAVITAYDEVAFGLIHTLRQSGIKIPDDISVIGINDIPMSEYFEIPLTSINVCKKEVCTSAVCMLFDKMNGKKTENVTVDCKLIIRKSTK